MIDVNRTVRTQRRRLVKDISANDGACIGSIFYRSLSVFIYSNSTNCICFRMLKAV